MNKRLELDYTGAISELEAILKKFNLKKKIYKILYSGRALEFEQFRNFDEGEDDATSIDWPASLKSDKLLVKQYKEETDINFYFVLDISNSMLFGSGKKLKAESASEMILALAYLVISSQDRAGLIMASNKVEKYFPPKNIKNYLFNIEDSLSNMDLYGGEINLKVTIDFLLNLIKNPRSMVVFVSDFLNLPSGIEKDFNLLANKCEVIALVVRDKFDSELPETTNPMVFSNSFGNQNMVVDTALASKAYKSVTDEKSRYMRKMFVDANVDFLELYADDDFILPLIQFLQKRSEDK